MKVCWIFYQMKRTFSTVSLLFVSSVSKILTQWFDSEPLRATLATDGVIGAMTSPSNPGSGWETFLAHHYKCTGAELNANGLSNKVRTLAPRNGGTGERERSMGLCGGRHGRCVPCYSKGCSVLRSRHFYRKGKVVVKNDYIFQFLLEEPGWMFLHCVFDRM